MIVHTTGTWAGEEAYGRALDTQGRPGHQHILRCDFKNGGLPLCPLHTGTKTHSPGVAAMDKEYGLRSR